MHWFLFLFPLGVFAAFDIFAPVFFASLAFDILFDFLHHGGPCSGDEIAAAPEGGLTPKILPDMVGVCHTYFF